MKGSSPPLDCRLRSNYALWKSKNATAIEKILLKNILKASEKMTLYFHFTGGIDDMSILKVKQLKKVLWQRGKSHESTGRFGFVY